MGENRAPPKNVAIALVHYPVYNRNREVVTTSVTSVDIHDIARISRTYGLYRFYIVTPVEAQRDMVMRIVDHWVSNEALQDHPRTVALRTVAVAPDLEEALKDFQASTGLPPLIVTTSARFKDGTISFEEMRRRIALGHEGVMLVFGTGWGLSEEVIAKSHFRLEPVRGVDDYNHLSVRSATAIILDRLLGDRV